MGTGNIVLTNDFFFHLLAIYILLGGKELAYEEPFHIQFGMNTQRPGNLKQILVIHRCGAMCRPPLLSGITMAGIKIDRF